MHAGVGGLNVRQKFKDVARGAGQQIVFGVYSFDAQHGVAMLLSRRLKCSSGPKLTVVPLAVVDAGQRAQRLRVRGVRLEVAQLFGEDLGDRAARHGHEPLG